MPTKFYNVIPIEAVEYKLAKADIFEPFVKLFLNNKKNVSEFLGVSVRVLNRWIEQDILKENVHYVKDENSIIYLHDALFEFKINPPSLKPKKEYKPTAKGNDFFN